VTIERELTLLLSRRTAGGAERIMRRACRIATLHGEFHTVGSEIVNLELL
jgi:hypothetical protein